MFECRNKLLVLPARYCSYCRSGDCMRLVSATKGCAAYSKWWVLLFSFTCTRSVQRQKEDFVWKSKSQSQLRETSGLQESGLKMTFYGCGKCPSTLYKTCKEGFPGRLILLAGSLDDDHMLPQYGVPEAELWVQHRLPWVKEIDGAKQCQTFT